MKTCTKCGETKPLDCFGKHKLGAGGLRPRCRVCHGAEGKAWKQANEERRAATSKQWKQDNKERIRETDRLWVAKNKDRRNQLERERRARNHDANLAKRHQHKAENADKIKLQNAQWKRDNAGKVSAYTRKRQAAALLRTPTWADNDKIVAIYKEAAAMRALGIEVHVDHVYPLQGNLVSGLHVHANLQLMLATDNIAKGNRMPEAT